MSNICSNKISELRKKNDLAQVDLAAELSVSYDIVMNQSDISEIERGVRGVRDYELKVFAKVFEVSTDFSLDK